MAAARRPVKRTRQGGCRSVDRRHAEAFGDRRRQGGGIDRLGDAFGGAVLGRDDARLVVASQEHVGTGTLGPGRGGGVARLTAQLGRAWRRGRRWAYL